MLLRLVVGFALCSAVYAFGVQRRRSRAGAARESAAPEVVVVKFGGAAITDKRALRTVDAAALAACAAAVADARRAGARVVVVHGAGSFGHFEAKQYGLAAGAAHPEWRAGFSETRAAVTELNRLCLAALAAEGVPAVAVAPMVVLDADDIRRGVLGAAGGRRLGARARDALRNDVVPVLHGDAVWDSAQGCAIVSGDALCVALVEELAAARAVFITDVDGVYDRPPSEPGSVLLRALYAEAPAPAARAAALRRAAPRAAPTLVVPGAVGAPRLGVLAHDVTGGMRAKLDAALRCAAADCPVTIVAVRNAREALRGAVPAASTLVQRR
ncbi:Aspartate/glutamate/uridylate kinase [Pelagophyceae sp. CCMP2097]|nr:Aspartate/glutamate/uridylate kinase [Pelagophyceae sp. CCMP2097]